MANVHETESRWGIGEYVLCVVFYFSAVWIFNAFLPPKPEQTPFETVPRLSVTSNLMTAPSTGTAPAANPGGELFLLR